MKAVTLTSIVLSSLTTVSAMRTTCTFKGIISEDHWEAKRAYPFGVCTEGTGAARNSYILPVFKTRDVATWSAGDVFELEVEKLHQPELKQAQVASWQSGAKDAWTVKNATVVSRTVNRRKLMWLGKQSRSVLSIRLKYSDASPDYCDETCVEDGMKQVEATTDASSYNILKWTQKKVITVDMGGSISPLRGCEFYQVDDQSDVADAAARTQHSIDPLDFDHVEYFLPHEAECTWGGLGELSDRRTWEVSGNSGIRLHEFGHNFGLHHAGTANKYDGVWDTCEYCDNSGPMGGAELVGNILPHMYNLEWILDSHVAKLHSAGVKNGPALNIRATSYDPRSGGLAGAYLTVKQPDYDPKMALWASLRTVNGVDNALWWDDRDKVFIHLGFMPTPGYGASNSKTNLLARLNAGQSYELPTTDPTWGDDAALKWDGECSGCAHVIKVCSLDAASGVAKITIGASADGAGAALSRANAACGGTSTSPPPPATGSPPTVAPPSASPNVSPPSDGICINNCHYSYDNDCDDGGANSDYDFCELGSDCHDCGPRGPSASPPSSLSPSQPSPPPPSPSPVSVSPSPSPTGDFPIPAGGVQVMYGATSADRMYFCLRPGMEHVKRISDIPGLPVDIARDTIAGQCCSPNDPSSRGSCRREVDGKCVAGFSGRPSRGGLFGPGFSNDPWIQPMTYGDTARVCASKGLVMCQQTCYNKGCWYNNHPVYTGKSCPASSPSPAAPPPAPESPSMPPPTPSPSPPRIEHGDWTEQAFFIFKNNDDTEDSFLQQCLSLCNRKGDECDGFLVKPRCGSGGKCCAMHKATTSYFSPNSTVFVKHGGSGTTLGAARAGSSISTSTPDWTYDSGDDDDDNSGSDDDAKSTVVNSQSASEASIVADTGTLVGVAIALAFSGILIGIAITLGVQRCRGKSAAKTLKVAGFTTAA